MIISVSIDKEQAEFLDSTNLSPSDLIQEKINEQRRIFDTVNQEKAYLLRNIQNLQAMLKDYSEFLELNEMFEKFTQWRKDVVQQKT